MGYALRYKKKTPENRHPQKEEASQKESPQKEVKTLARASSK